MVYTEEQWYLLYKKDKRRAIAYSEQYCVRFQSQNTETGFWEKNFKEYRASNRCSHDKIATRFKQDHPNAVVIRVEYL